MDDQTIINNNKHRKGPIKIGMTLNRQQEKNYINGDGRRRIEMEKGGAGGRWLQRGFQPKLNIYIYITLNFEKTL